MLLGFQIIALFASGWARPHSLIHNCTFLASIRAQALHILHLCLVHVLGLVDVHQELLKFCESLLWRRRQLVLKECLLHRDVGQQWLCALFDAELVLKLSLVLRILQRVGHVPHELFCRVAIINLSVVVLN